MEPSSPAGPEFEDEREELLGNIDNVPGEDEEEGEDLFGGDIERYELVKVVTIKNAICME